MLTCLYSLFNTFFLHALSSFLLPPSGFHHLFLSLQEGKVCLQEYSADSSADLLSTFAHVKTPTVFDNRLACCMQSRREQQEDPLTNSGCVEACLHYTKAYQDGMI